MSWLQSSETQWQSRLPLRESNSKRSASRPVSIADRLTQLSESAQSWTAKVQDKDMKKFTVDNKLDRIAGKSLHIVGRLFDRVDLIIKLVSNVRMCIRTSVRPHKVSPISIKFGE